MPAQAVCNKLQIFEAPAEIKNLNRLKRILIGRRILFKITQVTITPKGHFLKLKGAICNIKVADSNGLIMVKLKRKLS